MCPPMRKQMLRCCDSLYAGQRGSNSDRILPLVITHNKHQAKCSTGKEALTHRHSRVVFELLLHRLAVDGAPTTAIASTVALPFGICDREAGTKTKRTDSASVEVYEHSRGNVGHYGDWVLRHWSLSSVAKNSGAEGERDGEEEKPIHGEGGNFLPITLRIQKMNGDRLTHIGQNASANRKPAKFCGIY